MSDGRSKFLGWQAASKDRIGFQKVYFDLAGDIEAAVMLNEIIYWHLPNKEGEDDKLSIVRDGEKWMVRSYDSWLDKCCLKYDQARRCVKTLSDKRLIVTSVYRFNAHPTLHIRVDWDVFLKKWNDAVLRRYPDYIKCVNHQNVLGDHADQCSGDLTRSLAKGATEEQKTAASAAEGSFGFGKNGKTIQLSPAQLWASSAATKLSDSLYAGRGIMRTPDMNGWRKEMTKLHSEVRDELRPRIDEALSWFCGHWRDKYAPKIRSAKEFRKRIDDVVAAMERARESSSTTDDPDLEEEEDYEDQPEPSELTAEDLADLV